MKLDRLYQLELLTALSESYPRQHDMSSLVRSMDDAATERLLANIMYLEEHGLVEANVEIGIDGRASFGGSRITHRGLDFLADDGGLGAILGVVTIKIHADTIRDLVAKKIDEADVDEAQKSALKKGLATMTNEGLKTLAKSLVEKGLATLPDVVLWLQTLLHHA